MLKAIFYTLHMIGLVGIIVTLVISLRKTPKKLSAGTLHSAWLQFISGVALTGIDAGEDNFNYAPVIIKLLILVVIITLGYMNVKKTEVKASFLYTLLEIGRAHV